MDVIVVVGIAIELRLGCNGLLLEGRRWPVALVWSTITAPTAVVNAAYVVFLGDLGLSTEYPLPIHSFACTHLDSQAFLARSRLLKLLIIEERVDSLLIDVELLWSMRLTYHLHFLHHFLSLWIVKVILIASWPILSSKRLAVSTSLPLRLC